MTSIRNDLELQAARAYLERNVLQNITHLKMMGAHPEATEVHHIKTSDGEGVLTLLETAAFWYDRETYPSSKYIVLISSDSPGVTKQLLGFLPTHENLVFKLTQDSDQELLAQRFKLNRARGFISYSTQIGSRFQADPEVELTLEPNDGVYKLLEEQGHPRSGILPLLARDQAFVCTLEQDDRTVSGCLAFQIHDHIWEIGAVFTNPESRGQGFAKRLVSTALAELESRDLTPRYQVLDDNTASIRLAESVGLEPFVTLTHWTNFEENP
jgi:ribosomal protein S18 acetylase RimI-like enzyme